MTTRRYWSQRQGSNGTPAPLAEPDLKRLLVHVLNKAFRDDHLVESFGQECPDEDSGWIDGPFGDISDRLLVDVQREDLWPPTIDLELDAVYDLVEFVHDHVSKPVDGHWHSYWRHTHWEKFDRAGGQASFRSDVNRILERAEPPVQLGDDGHIRLTLPDGYGLLVEAPLPAGTEDPIVARVSAAVTRYKEGRTTDDIRHAVRDLADAMEMLRDDAKVTLRSSDERDLFEMMNRFGIRHLNAGQKIDYDVATYSRWQFYVLLATVHLVLRVRETSPSAKP